ncbi:MULTISPECIES: L,D-transpeptidase family protein [Mesorhizobium]|uniref:Murein L,D-transpeptidase n=1 Tax=Mesorhizobium denitrificans TaxID=2294114 RepID=A0A371X9D2_9HYPH|nr:MULTISPECIES: L,D-transpeptidase family protein [Mesorhizobium]RFC65644.1 murein L,D-transpeptidase [Mesorhizobium denitrificans]
MNKSRRFFLAGTGALALSAVAKAAMAQAQEQDFLSDVLSSPRRGNWDDTFDAQVSASGQQGKISTTQPIFSPQTIAYTQQAINDYRNLASQGGWPQVPATKKLQLGVDDPDVQVLRQRLIASGDLAREAGVSSAFDTYVDAALKRFQKRHGLPADGVTGKYTFAAMNISAQVRLGQLETNLVRLQSTTDLGQRYVLVNIPAAQIEAVDNGRVVLRHTAIVGKIDRQTPIVNSRINEIIINPYWNAPESIIRKDIIPLMRKNPNYLTDNNIHIIGPDGQEIPPTSIDWSTEDAARYRMRQDPGKINAMASIKINFPSPDGVYMHDTPSQSLFNKLMRFDSSGCVRVQNVRDLVTWILKNTPGWGRQQIEDAIKAGENHPIAVADPVPVHFLYISAWSTGPGVVQFRDDIYGRDGVDELQITSAL